MGTWMAPAYAYIFMAYFEKKTYSPSPSATYPLETIYWWNIGIIHLQWWRIRHIHWMDQQTSSTNQMHNWQESMCGILFDTFLTVETTGYE